MQAILPTKEGFSSHIDRALIDRKDILDVTAGLLAEKSDTVAKAISTGIGLAQATGFASEDNQTLNEANDTFKLIKAAHAPKNLSQRVVELRDKANAFWENSSLYNTGHLLLAGNKCIGPIYEGTDFLSKTICHFSKNAPWFQNFTGINALSLIATSGYNTYCDWAKIGASKPHEAKTEAARRIELKNVGKAFFDLIRDVSCIALGILVVLSTFFAFVFHSNILLALNVTIVFLTILNYYYTNLGEVKKTNLAEVKNLVEIKKTKQA